MIYCEDCTPYCSLCIIFVSFWFGRRTNQYVMSLLLLSTVLWTHTSFKSPSKRDPEKANYTSQVNCLWRRLWEDGLDLGCPTSAIWRLVDCNSQHSSLHYFQGLQGWTLLIRLKGEFKQHWQQTGKDPRNTLFPVAWAGFLWGTITCRYDRWDPRQEKDSRNHVQVALDFTATIELKISIANQAKFP